MGAGGGFQGAGRSLEGPAWGHVRGKLWPRLVPPWPRSSPGWPGRWGMEEWGEQWRAWGMTPGSDSHDTGCVTHWNVSFHGLLCGEGSQAHGVCHFSIPSGLSWEPPQGAAPWLQPGDSRAQVSSPPCTFSDRPFSPQGPRAPLPTRLPRLSSSHAASAVPAQEAVPPSPRPRSGRRALASTVTSFQWVSATPQTPRRQPWSVSVRCQWWGWCMSSLPPAAPDAVS